MDDGRFAIRVEEQLQAVGKGNVLDGEVGDLAVREPGQEQCEREAADLIAAAEPGPEGTPLESGFRA